MLDVTGVWKQEKLEDLMKVIAGSWDDKWVDSNLKLMGIDDSKQKVFEIGAGVGRLLKRLKEKYNKEVAGCDFSEQMVRYAKDYIGDGIIRLCRGQGETTEINETYDLIFSFTCFQHINNSSIVKRYLKEAWRICKPGGQVKFQLLKRKMHKGGTWTYHDIDTLKSLLDKFGFYNIQVKHISDAWLLLEAHKPKIRFFFRDDDIDNLTPTFLKFIQVFIDEGVPVNLATIPETLTPDMISFLKDYIYNYPNVIEIHQHGVSHRAFEPYSEFPVTCDPNELKQRIDGGNRKLQTIFGANYIKVFTAPWHSFDKNFLPILEELKFFGISDRFSYANYGKLRNFSVILDVATTDDKFPDGRFRTTKELIDRFNELKYNKSTTLSNNPAYRSIGMIMHHRLYWNKHNGDPYGYLRGFIQYLKNNDVKIVKFSEIYD